MSFGKRKIRFVGLWIVFGFMAMQGRSEKAPEPALNAKYRDWLDLVATIVQSEERNAFLELGNDRDRDLFISLFWNLRDPTPETPENEFKNEHVRRFEYAKRYFKFGSTRPGWQTDMGRIYILLGEPDSRDRYENDSLVVPVQVWSYSGQGRPGLPNAFWVVFFKRGEAGEFKRYNPLSDGPFELLKRLPSTNMDANDYESIHDTLVGRHPLLALASTSLLPDEPAADYRPTIKSQILLKEIDELPRRGVRVDYATHFLKYRGLVQVEDSTNFVECSGTTQIFADPLSGLNFVHFALLPKTLSIDYLKDSDRYYFHFRLHVSLKKGEKTVFTYKKSFPFYLQEGEAEREYASGVVICDYFPVPCGIYDLEVLLQNDVKGEFSFFERRLTVRSPEGLTPVLFGPLVSAEKRKVSAPGLRAYRIDGMDWSVNPRAEFGCEEPLFILVGIDGRPGDNTSRLVAEIEEIGDAKKIHREYPVAFAEPAGLQYPVLQIGNLPAGNYRVRVRAEGESGVPFAVVETTFMVSMIPRLPRPAQAFKVTAEEGLYRFYHILGYEYSFLDDLERSEVNFAKAFALKKDDANLVRDYCRLLLKKKAYARVLDVAESLQGKVENMFAYHSLCGAAFFYLGDADRAIVSLQKANAIYDSDIEVLNRLGFCYLKTGRDDEAARIFQASIKVFPDQKEIVDLLAKLKKSK